MSENNKGKVVKSSIGVLGALATIISVWWFAFAPPQERRRLSISSRFSGTARVG